MLPVCLDLPRLRPVRRWVRRAQVDADARPETTTEHQAGIVSRFGRQGGRGRCTLHRVSLLIRVPVLGQHECTHALGADLGVEGAKYLNVWCLYF
jgi:hypothetical protein